MIVETELDQVYEVPTGGNMIGCLVKALLIFVVGMLGAGVLLGVILFDVLAQALR